jgi:GAF domain-containing protein
MPSPSLSPDNQEVLSVELGSDFQRTLTVVCETAVKLVGVDHSGLVIFDQDLKAGTVFAEYPAHPATALKQRVRVSGIPVEEKLVHERQPIVINDVRNDSSLGPVQPVLVNLGIKSIVVVPIIVDDEVKGSFSFDSIHALREFADSDVQKCRSLARFASTVVKNAYLVENLTALRQAMLAIASEQDRIHILNAITEEAVNLLHASGGGIDELDEARGELTVVAPFNISAEIVGKKMKLGEGLAGRVIKEKLDYMAVENYAEWEGRAPEFKDITALESLIGVRLRLDNKETGVLWLNAIKGRVFSSAEIELLKGLAAPASIALEQSELREKERDKAKRLQVLAEAITNILGHIATGNRKERLTAIARYAHEITNAETCGILLVEEPRFLTLVSSHGHKEGGFEEGKKLKIDPAPGQGLSGYIASQGNVFSACGDDLRNHFAVKDKTFGSDYSPSGECFSLLAVPLMKEGEVRGLIRISNKKGSDERPSKETCFTEDDKLIGKIFAEAALITIETADLFDKVTTGEHRYKTVLDALNVLAEAKVPKDGLDALAKMIVGVLGKSFCRISLYREPENELQIIAAVRNEDKKAFRWKSRVGEKAKIEDWKGLDRALQSGRLTLLRISDEEDARNLKRLAEWTQLTGDDGKLLEISSMLSIPLKADSRKVGLLNIGEIESTEDFTAIEIEEAEAISQQVSLLIERLETDKRLLHDLFETERAINSSSDLETTLKLVAAQVFNVAHAWGRSVNVVDINILEGTKIKVVAVFPGDRLPLIERVVGDNFDITIGKNNRIGIVGRVLIEGKAIMEGDVSGNLDYLPIHDDTRSQLVVPIFDAANTTIGAISVENSALNAFTEQDLILVNGLAGQASSAIAKYAQSRENKKVRTIALVGAAGSIWKHSFKPAAGFISNEAGRALAQETDVTKLREALTQIREKAKSMEDFPFTGPLSRDPGISEELLNTVIRERLDRLRAYIARQDVKVKIRANLAATDNRKVRINKEWFQFALKSFLVNAREAILEADKKIIEVRTEMADDKPMCYIFVKNTGRQIPNEIWGKLGNEQIDRDGERGVGLLIADLVLAVYGGKFEKLINEQDNIVMRLSLPICS